MNAAELLTERPHIAVAGHPVKARDSHEARTLARDTRIAALYDMAPATRDLWLVTRAYCRRDLLYFCRNALNKDRITERIHRAPVNFLMRGMTTPHFFGNFRDVRGNGKTTISTEGGSLWCVIQDTQECVARGWPILGRESRLGITTLNEQITTDFIGLILSDLESETFGWLFPDVLPDKRRRWGVKTGVLLRRGLVGDLAPLADDPLFAGYPGETRQKEPTFANGSLEKGRAGAHTHGELVDDPVNEKTWNSPTNIATAKHAIKQLYNVARTERGFRLIIGNHWCPDDVADGIDRDPEVTRKWEVFMRSAEACEECKDGFPIDSTGLVPRDDTGDWQHRCDPERRIPGPWMMEEAGGNAPNLEDIRASCGSYHIFSAQYLNRPLAGESTLWKAEMLGHFSVVEKWWDESPRFPRPATGTPIPMQRLVCSDTILEVPDRLGTLRKLKVADCAVSIAYDPAHTEGAKGTNADHAITTLIRTPFDTFALGDCWTGHPNDPLDAIDEFLRIIWRFRMFRLKVGVEAVGYQKTVRSHLLRGLLQRRDANGNVTEDGTGSLITWLRVDNVIAIPRSKAEGDKTAWVRDSIGPLIQTRAFLFNPSIRGARNWLTAIEGFPVSRIGMDIRDSTSMHLSLLDRVPLTAAFKTAARRQERMRQIYRERHAGPSGYGC